MLFRPRCRVAGVAALAGLLLAANISRADMFTGTLYYTDYAGTPNVNSVNYTYNDTSHSLTVSLPHPIATTPGADGIIFAPDGSLLVGGQGTGDVFKVDPTNGSYYGRSADGQSYHLALDPSGTKVYTSNFEGPLAVLPLTGGTTLGNGTTYAVHGGDTGVTQLAFAPNGKVFYTDGNPNGFGNFGTIDISNLSNIQTTRLQTDLRPAHGIIYDSFTDTIDLFGAGSVAVMDAATGAKLGERDGINADFDQGSVDGQGHAFIAGNGDLTFIDYSQSHNLADPNNPTFIVGGFGNIDDLAPLSGLGSNASTPEPSSMTLLGLGAAGLFLGYRRRRAKS